MPMPATIMTVTPATGAVEEKRRTVSQPIANRSRCKGERSAHGPAQRFNFYVAVTAMQDRLAVTSPPFSGR